MTDEYEVKVTVGDSTVEVKGPEKGVVEIVKALSAILASERKQDHREHSEPKIQEKGSGDSRDPRSLFATKSPSTQIEAVVLAAYYLQDVAPVETRSDTIDSVKAQQVFRMASYPLPGRIRQVLVNAHAAGYLDRSGQGEYRLNPVGYNLVVHSLGTNE